MTSYRVLRGPIKYPTSPTVLRRLRSGERIPLSDRGLRTARAGDVVADVPRESIPWLLRQGYIELVQDGGAEEEHGT